LVKEKTPILMELEINYPELAILIEGSHKNHEKYVGKIKICC